MTATATLDSTYHIKNKAALTSVLAAVGLTTFNLMIGVATGSLGILAEALTLRSTW